MRVIAAGSVVVLVVMGLFLVRPTPIADLDLKACDLLTGWAGPGKQSGRVVIVEIDEESLRQFGRWPWRRDLVGKLARGILDRGAAAVVLDVMFPQEDRANDDIFADALTGKPAIVGYTLRFNGEDGGSEPCAVPTLPLVVAAPDESRAALFFHATGAVCSAPAISRAATGGGFLNAAPDRDGTIRRVPLVMEYANRYYPSLALAALNLYRKVSVMQLTADEGGARRLRLDAEAVRIEGPSLLRLRFRGPRRSFPYVSAAAVLAGRAPEDRLRGKIAIVGGSAPGVQNPVVTPVDPMFPDVEIQATAVDNLLQGDSLRRPGDALFWELALALLAGLGSTLLLIRLQPLWGALTTLGLAAGVWAGSALMLSSTRTLLSPLPATAVLVCNLPVLALVNSMRERKRADRTQQQLAEAREHSREVLRESESRYRRLVENVNDAIIMDDVAGRLVFANRRFREWFGLQEAEISKVAIEQYVAPEWQAEARDRHDRRMRGEAVPAQFEFEGIRSDGTRMWIEALVTALEEDGQITGTQAALRDTTERKRIEAQYLQAQKMESVGRLAGGLAHDFNNLLTVINGYSAMLLGRAAPDDRSRPPLEQILKAGERAAELTQKLLAFSRKQFVKVRPLNLNLLVTEAEQMLDRVIGEDIELITRLSPDLGSVRADPGQMQQVLVNLIVNARDAMPNGGKLVIETKNVEADDGLPKRASGLAAGSCVCLSVMDTGTGMSEEVKQHLYEPFFTTKDQGLGTGLGLATVYGIVHQCGGEIEVVSALGQGTTFHIYLPRINTASAEKPDATPAAPPPGGSETVLIVEDQDEVRQLASTILEKYGYRVLQASNGSDAIALAEQYPDTIHLLLTDVIMPVMDGRVLADKLKAVRPATKVLFVSGYSAEKIGLGTGLDGDLAYLPKPFRAEALAARVREILGR